MSLQRRTALAVLARQRQIAQARNERTDLLDRQVGSWRKWYKKRLELLRLEKKEDRDLVKVFQLSLYSDNTETHEAMIEGLTGPSEPALEQPILSNKETNSSTQPGLQQLSVCDPVGLVGESHPSSLSKETVRVFHVGSTRSGIGDKLVLLNAPLDSLDLYRQDDVNHEDALKTKVGQKDTQKITDITSPEKDNSIYLSLID